MYYLVINTSNNNFVIVTETHATSSWCSTVYKVLQTSMRSCCGHSAQNFVDGLHNPYYKLLHSSPNPITADDIPELLI